MLIVCLTILSAFHPWRKGQQCQCLSAWLVATISFLYFPNALHSSVYGV